MIPVVAHIGHEFSGREVTWLVAEWWVIAVLTVASVLYLNAQRRLRQRRRSIPGEQQAAWWMGLGCVAVALLTAIDPISDTSLVSMHMIQHLLIADIGGLLIVMGIRAPVCFFLWPAPVVKAFARTRVLPRLWQTVTRPQVALPLWLTTLYLWHVPVMFEAALSSEPVHILQHAAFMITGTIAWWPVVNPTRRSAEAGMWKPGYIALARGAGTGVLAFVLMFTPFQIYTHYGTRATDWGIDPILDQQIGAATMMLVDFAIAAVGFLFFVFRSAADDGRGRARDRIAAEKIRTR